MASLHNRVRQYLKQQAALTERKRECRLRQISSLCGGDLHDGGQLAKASSSKKNDACSMPGGQGFFEQILRKLNGSDASRPSGSRRLPTLEIVSSRKCYQPVLGDPVCRVLRQRPFAVVRNSPQSRRRKHRRLCKPSCHCNVWRDKGEGEGEVAGCDEKQPQQWDKYACPCCRNHRRGPLQSVLVTPVSEALGQHHYSARPVNGHQDDGKSCEVCARLAQDSAAAATSAGRRRLGQERRVINCRAMLIYQPPDVPPPPLSPPPLSPPPFSGDKSAVTDDKAAVDGRLETEHTLTTSVGTPPVVGRKKGWC